jgi:outer membrane protein OmpA-like peptidoglycan-associated protein
MKMGKTLKTKPDFWQQNSKPKQSLLLIFILLVCTNFVFAQNDRKSERWFSQARQHFMQQSFEPAIDYCERILKRDSSYVDAHLMLADIYRETQNSDKEILHLQKAAALENNQLVFFRLGEALYSVGKYAHALTAYQNYSEFAGQESSRTGEVKRKIENCRFSLDAIENPVEFHPRRLPDAVNSVFDEYWPSLSIDGKKLVVTRLVKTPGQLPQEDFYISEFGPDGWAQAHAMADLNTPENEGAQSLSADGSILFFTACNRSAGMGSCDIYYSFRKDSKWSRPVNAGPPLNTKYWEAQPSVSSDGRTLYFTSNRPGGKGEKDIWRAEISGIDEKGLLKWEEPWNPGDSINTPGNETSPFIHAGNKSFYFASDYHTGMGGFDLFMATIKNDSVFSEAQNLGFPVNTFNNEQGLFVSTDGQTAYFSSERNKKSGLDIYSFTLDESIQPEPATYVHATVVDAISGNPVTAEVELVNLTNKEQPVRNEKTDNNGEMLLCLPSGADYSFSVSRQGYLFYSDAFELTESRQIYDPYLLTIELIPVQVGAEMNLYNIYFETDSFTILPESEPELMKLAGFLKTNPGLKVEIQGHTDNTGHPDSNQELSELRAKSVAAYLTEHGIKPTRLSTAGYGEDRPVATNDTPEGRRMNRRTTIKVLENEN